MTRTTALHAGRRRTARSTLSALAAASLFAAAAAAASAAPARLATSAWCGERCDELVIDWNQTAHQVIKAADDYTNPMAASRALAMTHLAMHDAVNAAAPRYAGYALAQRTTGPGADAALAAVTAAHDVLLALYPAQKDLLRASLDKSQHDAGSGAAAMLGSQLGREAAQAVLAKRARDGSAAQEIYREGSAAGEYRFVPGTTFIAAPHWRQVEPFALRSPSQFRVTAPPALGSAEYSAAFNEVKAAGAQGAGTTRTAEQSQYAAFWYEFSDAGWNRIARVVSRQQPQDLWERARLFALLNAAMADAYIAGWDSKLHYNFWRPVTAIRLAADDGNPGTAPDAGWTSLLPTPPIQDHPSTHSALGAAAAAVLAASFKRDALAFSFSSPSALPGHAERSFKSFSAAALENADSRVRAGLHFRFAANEGLALGRKVGAFAVAQLLTPLH
jgi:hypothetical protein